MATASQHELEFGGSPVAADFDGTLSVLRIDRIPVFSVSDVFRPLTARQIRYCLVATVGPERPFYHRYPFVALDVRMVRGWEPGGDEFVRSLRERLVQLGGELALIVPPRRSDSETAAPEPDRGPLSAEIPAFTTRDDALACLKQLREERRRAAIAAALAGK